jgi:hypothetical protein
MLVRDTEKLVSHQEIFLMVRATRAKPARLAEKLLFIRPALDLSKADILSRLGMTSKKSLAITSNLDSLKG